MRDPVTGRWTNHGALPAVIAVVVVLVVGGLLDTVLLGGGLRWALVWVFRSIFR